MRFALKVFLPGMLVVALAVSVTGYALAMSAFSTALQTEKQKGFDRVSMLSVVVESMTQTHTRPSGDGELVSVMRSVSTGDFNSARLYSADGALLYGAGETADAALFNAAQTGMAYRLTENGSARLVQMLRPIQLGETTGFLYLEQDVSAAFELCAAMLREGARNTLVAIAAVGVILFVTSLYITRSVRALSGVTRAFARGAYERRAKKATRDEIGDLAVDFNCMADALQAHIARMEGEARRREDFVASFAHELKTPLTSIIGYADTLRSMELNEESRFSCANYIFTEGRRLERLSLKLLELMVLERQEFVLSEVAIAPLVGNLMEATGEALRQRYGVAFELRLEEQMVAAEPDLLSTLVINLAENAAKASKSGQKVFISGHTQGDVYRLCVADEGIGISKDDLARVTEAFYMVDKSRSRAQNGSGLGLALCASIAKLHRAELSLTSEKGTGTAACVALRVVKRSEYED